MFCPNCGMKNDDNAIFCFSCGTRMNEEQTADQNTKCVELHKSQEDQSTVDENDGVFRPVNQFNPGQQSTFAQNPTAGRRVNKLTIVALVELAAIVIAVIVFYKVGDNVFGYKHVAESYFQNVMNGNWEDVYEQLDVEQSQFVNKDEFIKIHKNDKCNSFNMFDIANSSSDNVSAKAAIEYRLKGSQSTSTMYTELNKQNDNNLIIFDNWKISGEQYVCKNFSIAVPENAKISVDGNALSSELKSTKSKDGFDTYVISSILKGSHKLLVTIDGFDSIEQEVDVDANDYSYSVDKISLTKKQQEKLIEKASDNIQDIYKAAFAGKKFKEISKLYSSDKDIQESAEDRYKSFVSYNFISEDNKTGFLSIDYKKMSGEIESIYIYDSKIYVEGSIDYSYKYDYNHQGWFDDEVTKETEDGEDSTDFKFVYEKGDWLQVNTYMPMGCN